MDSRDESVDGEVYQAHEIIAHGSSGRQEAGEQQEMLYMFMSAYMVVRTVEKRKCLWMGAVSGPRDGR
jgi:hypothetical protein